MKHRNRVLAAAAIALAVGAPAAAQILPLQFIDEAAPGNGALHYAAGGYFYGADCGGNAVQTSASGHRSGAASGVILGGAGGDSISAALNCEDRRQALGAYRDGFEGQSGQHYDWRDSEGGDSGSVTPLRQYLRGGYACRDFSAVMIVDRHAIATKGTACRQQDGNWHTL